ncbi:UvrD-helicase domain-containing protein [Modestobacter sp. VKM Ac-2978]|uniref:UvrD-helicase domain-containing protein n=1 Tax=Modestobacter sp. VKM Ac-2978 TaxID=3004132 RepID=UPI0022AA1FCA|nr:UvrD-helicase domain-containing protein [Modestobacter sp. VKM Ac-2978]MCZ2849021.1 UvrD-helicase domain-containing protein [Modestobacter sp. VKM Ac-2978]
MSIVLTPAGAIGGLTDEQQLAAAARTKNVFIEAGPGTGKTTVSAHRFGVHRFALGHGYDQRAIVAVSFTRAATYNLARRVQRLWGPSALTWPHRIVTLDTLICDLLHDLLRNGLLVWPNTETIWADGDITLDIHDSWARFRNSTPNQTKWRDRHKATRHRLTLSGRHVTVQEELNTDPSRSVSAAVTIPLLRAGKCTHQEVRDLVGLALQDPSCAARIRQRLATTMRALIVDEVFDANDLDIAFIETAIAAGIAVTLVGDPWQALYDFRGARPAQVMALLQRADFRTLQLTRSFRWRDDSQRDVALDLRDGQGVVLPVVKPGDGTGKLDVVLAPWWQDLWDLDGSVLPLAFHGYKGNGYEEAAATLLLNHVTRSILDMDATYLNDALTALDVGDHDPPRELEPGLQRVAELLRVGGKQVLNSAYDELNRLVSTVSERKFRAAHGAHTKRLAQIQERLVYPGRPVPGLTTHQAKGSEWDSVGVRLNDDGRAALASGLSPEHERDRRLYVACTRAHRRTVEVEPPPTPLKKSKRKSKKQA